MAINRGMVLAAGKGTRMREISDTLPKPLVEVGGRALLDRVLDHFERAGISEAVVNVHHLADTLEDHLLDRVGGPEILISDEREMLLETGGGVLSALEAFEGEPFFVVNSDALWVDGDTPLLENMRKQFDPVTTDILLALVPKEKAIGFDGAGDFFMNADGALTWRGDKPVAPWVFGGIQILSPDIFEGEMLGCWSLKRLYDRAAADGRLKGIIFDGHWMHVGTPEAITEAEEKLSVIGAA